MSDREVEVLTWAARGKTSAEIGVILDPSKQTVDFHLDNARTKLGAATRIEAAGCHRPIDSSLARRSACARQNSCQPSRGVNVICPSTLMARD